MVATTAVRIPFEPSTVSTFRDDFAKSARPLDMIGARTCYPADSSIYLQGEPAGHIYRVVSGAVRISTLLCNGRRQVNAFCLPGELFGLTSGEVHHQSAEAISDSVVAAFKVASLERLLDCDEMTAREVWQATAADLDRAHSHMVVLGRKTALERIATFLLEMAGRATTGRLVLLPMSRNDIADYLGLTIETVSRALSQLEHDNLIELLSARRIILKDRAALAELDA